MAVRTFLKLNFGGSNFKIQGSSFKSFGRKIESCLWFPVFLALAAAGFLLRHFPLRKKRVKVALLAIGGLGDHLFCMPLLGKIKKEYPSASITLITDSHGIEKWNLLADSVLAWRKRSPMPDFLQAAYPMWAAFRRMPWMAARVFLARYDYGISIGVGSYNAAYGALLFALTGTKRRLGSFQVPKSFRHKLTSQPPERRAGENIRGLYSRIFPGNDPEDKSWREYVWGDEKWASEFLLKTGVRPGDLKVVIHPGGKDGINLRRLGPEKYQEIAARLQSEYGGWIFLTGSSEEQVLCNQVRFSDSHHVINLAGKASFTEMLGLLALADLVITNDTSALHFANAVNARKIVAVFGPTSPDFVAPESQDCLIVKSGAACAPCVEFDAADPSTSCKQEKIYHCLQDLSVEQVWKSVVSALSSLGIPSKGANVYA